MSSLDDALEALLQQELAVEAPLSTAASYVKLRKDLEAHEAILANKATLAVLLPGNTGIHVHERAGPDEIEALKSKLRGLAYVLGILPGQALAPESVEYQEGLRELKAHTLLKFQIKAEAEAFKRRQLETRATMEESKNLDSVRKSLAANRNNIKKLLSVIFTWEAVGTAAEGRQGQPSEVVVEAACKGQFSWSIGAAPDLVAAGDVGTSAVPTNDAQGMPAAAIVPTPAAMRHFGVRYRLLKNQEKRTIEERAILRIEVLRTLNWMEERTIFLNQRLVNAAAVSDIVPMVRHAHTSASTQGIQATAQAISDGRCALLNREIAWLERLETDTQRLKPWLAKLPEPEPALAGDAASPMDET